MKLTIARIDDLSIFRIGGKVGWESSRLLDREVRAAVESKTKYLVFDLDDIEFLSSGAIGVLVYHLRKLQGGNGDIFVLTSNQYVMYLFRTIGFHRVFEGKIFGAYPDLAAKLQAMGIQFAAPEPSAWRVVEARNEEDDERSLREESP
ncbi:MAG TPA: STAS domain-containing protein [Fibrobacteria bacterium]|nr:STAS domain-containing protein [Fibrobacteria bacterium]